MSDTAQTVTLSPQSIELLRKIGENLWDHVD